MECFLRISIVALLLSMLEINHSLADTELWSRLRLPEEHIPYYFYNNKHHRGLCSRDTDCPYQKYTKVKKCWGYEKNCPVTDRMYMPQCTGEHKGWVRRKVDDPVEAHTELFWSQADFGYVKERLDELTPICFPQKEGDSSLYCSQYLRYCQAKNLYMDFRNFSVSSGKNNRYRDDVFEEGAGQLGGYCKMYKTKLASQGEHMSPLQSWFAELRFYDAVPFKPIKDGKCDVIFDKPTILMKLDAGVNMYHHFCDYVNLYASQHMNNSFSMDIQIIMWDTSPMRYGDFFTDTWQAFSYYPYIHLNTLTGKRVCFKDAVFSLLPRMRRGLYYNMPLVPNCNSTSLFRAFSQHVLHRLNKTQEGPLEDKVRITLLSRSTAFRKILNQDELVAALEKIPGYEVRVVDYNGKFPFLDQLQVTYNSDVLIGMHGAGLTHMLFQPDWGVVFEIWHCEDPRCYHDLARLRGLRYMTWEDPESLTQEDEGHHPQLGAHAKFTNYAFGVEEFKRRIAEAAAYVRNHPRYKAAWEAKYAEPEKEEAKAGEEQTEQTEDTIEQNTEEQNRSDRKNKEQTKDMKEGDQTVEQKVEL